MYKCDEYLNTVLKYFGHSFDIKKDVHFEKFTADAFACFKCRNEKYILSQKATLWDYEINEYNFFFCRNFNSKEEFVSLRNSVLEEGLSLVKPNSEHMSSDINMIIISENINEDIKKEIKKYKYTKTYRFNFYGRAYFQTSGINLTDKNIFCTYRNKEIKPFFEKAFGALGETEK